MSRNLHFLFAAVLLFLFTSVASAQLFEGTITMEISSPKLPQPMRMVVETKGEKTTTDMTTPMGSMRVYMDQKSDKIITVMGKMGMEMDLKKVKDKVQEKTASKNMNIVATGEKKTINGHSCALYKVTAKDSNTSNWWMTGDLPKSLLNSLRNIYSNSARNSMASRNSGPGSEAIAEMFKKGLVPIQVEMLKNGSPETTMTFVSYEQKNIDDSEFIIPKDVTIRPMPAMPGMGGE